jgi:hypothetical protein
MKRYLFLLLLFSSGTELFAQLGVTIMSDRKGYLLYEPIYIKVRIRNYSGKSLVFGETEVMSGSLNFIITTPEKGTADKRKNFYNPLAGVVLAPGAVQESIVPINKIYNLISPGKYFIKAVVAHKQLPAGYNSNDLTFSVENGRGVWEKQVGIPEMYASSDTMKNDPRTVKLLSFFDEEGKVYAIQIENRYHVFGTVRIGYDIGGSPPECEVDGLSRTHILLQNSPNVFAYYRYDINCALDERDVFVKTETVPTLIVDTNTGNVTVMGGRKAVKGVDYVDRDGKTEFIMEQKEKK